MLAPARSRCRLAARSCAGMLGEGEAFGVPNGFGGALAGGDDDDGGVDRRTSGDGHARLSEPSLVSPEEAGRRVANTRADPLFPLLDPLFDFVH